MMSYSSSKDQAQDLLPVFSNAGSTAGASGGGGEGAGGGGQEDQISSAQRPFASSSLSTAEKVEPWFEGLTVYVRVLMHPRLHSASVAGIQPVLTLCSCAFYFWREI
jgi:hypothetical protein